MGRATDLILQGTPTGRATRAFAEQQGSVQNLNDFPLPPQKPRQRTATDAFLEAGTRIAEAFAEPFAQPGIFAPTPLPPSQQYDPTLALVHGTAKITDDTLKLMEGMTNAVIQGGAEVAGPILGTLFPDPDIAPLTHKEYAEATKRFGAGLREIAPAFAAPELLMSGLAPRMRRVKPPERPTIPQNPLGTNYDLGTVLNGKLKADAELERQARTSLNLLTPDKANLNNVLDNYRFWVDQLDPGATFWPSTDGTAGPGVVGFRTRTGKDYTMQGQGTRPPGLQTPSDKTVYLDEKKFASLEKAQQVQAGKGNTAGLHYDLGSGQLYFTILDPANNPIKSTPSVVRTTAAPKVGHRPIEVVTDQGTGLANLRIGDTIAEVHQEAMPSTREKMFASFKARAEASEPGKVYPIVGSPGEVTLARAAADRAITDAEAITLRKAYNAVRRQIWDRAGSVRQALLQRAGPAGEDAAQKYALSAGAPGNSSREFQEKLGEIYGGLIQGRMSLEEKRLLDEVVDSRRNIQIMSYRPDFRSPYGKVPADFEQNLLDIRNRVGEAKWLELNGRADRFFGVMQEQLVKLRQAGLVDDADFEKLLRFEYSPREYVDLVDPTETYSFGKATMNVRSSGIESLGKGSDIPLERNSDTLLAQVIARVNGRIARNDATKSLKYVAEQADNGIVSLSKDDPALGARPTPLTYMEDGKRHTLYMNRDYAKEWLNYRPEWQGTVGRWLGKWTGANVLRTVATGINPLAGPFLFLMDAQNAIMTSHMYSTFLPKGAMELGHDLWTVMPDVVTRGPRFQKYAEEGGLMPFLVHGGRTGGSAIPRSPFEEMPWNALRSGLGYWNESFELAMRLAIRERGLRQGLLRQQATYEARQWIDFSQGGHAAKFVDNVIPYTNAAIQGLRQLPYNFKKDPAKFSLKMAQLAAATGALYTYNWMRYPYVMEQVPEEEQGKYFIFPTDMHSVDTQGQKRFLYYKVPVPQNLRWFKALTDGVLSLGLRGQQPTREVVQGASDSFGIFGNPAMMAVPVVKAAMEYQANYDFYNARNIWNGADNIPPSQEFRQLPDTPSSRLAIDLGQLTGLSPERMTQAFHDVVPRSLYSDAVDWAYRYLRTGDALPEDAPYVTGPDANLYVARQFPFLSRLIGVTHPLANLYEKVQDTAQAGQGEAFKMSRQLDTLSMAYARAEGVEKQKALSEVKAFLRSVPDYARQRLQDRFETTLRVDRVYSRYGQGLDVPPKKFWTIVADLPAETRAEVYYEQWASRDGPGKRAMQALARSIPGFYSNPFGVMFNRIRAARGTSPEE